MRLVAALYALALITAPVLSQDEDYDPYANVVVSDDLAALPEPVRAMREALIAATRSGDIENLRPIMEAQEYPPTVSFGGPDDAVAYLRDQSDDPEGQPTLALLRNLLEMPYAVETFEDGRASYVWPYLAAVDLEKLTPEQTVDAYRLVTPEEFDDLAAFGGWFWWRVHIGADGEWQAFVAGD
jgi:hypothetical protein